jgi:hypothetical protein
MSQRIKLFTGFHSQHRFHAGHISDGNKEMVEVKKRGKGEVKKEREHEKNKEREE